VEIMRGPSLDEFSARVESYRPTFVYISGPYSGLVDSIKGAIGPIRLQGRWHIGDAEWQCAAAATKQQQLRLTR
jgi:hypothetical protein